MRPLLFDKGLPAQVARALFELGLDASAVGDRDGPAGDASDDGVVAWCRHREAVLITNDRGKKERTMITALNREGVNAVFVYNDLRAAPAHHLARAVLIAEPGIEQLSGQRKAMRKRLAPTGRLISRE